jgi:hypothetical protein
LGVSREGSQNPWTVLEKVHRIFRQLGRFAESWFIVRGGFGRNLLLGFPIINISLQSTLLTEPGRFPWLEVVGEIYLPHKTGPFEPDRVVSKLGPALFPLPLAKAFHLA